MPYWGKRDITAFLMSGIGGAQSIIGEPYVDGDEIAYLLMSQSIMIYSASSQELKDVLKKALTKEVRMTIYTEDQTSQTYCIRKKRINQPHKK